MTWTTNKPTQPGWYWYRRPSVIGGYYKDVCRVRQIDIDNSAIAFLRDTEWAGPIPEPVKRDERESQP